MSEFKLCEAENFLGVLVCGRCAQHWPASAPIAERPECLPRAAPPITFAEMHQVVFSAARAAVNEQVVLCKSGAGFYPHMDVLRRAAVFYATARMIELIGGDIDLQARINRAASQQVISEGLTDNEKRER